MTNKIKFGSTVIPYTVFKTNRRKTSQIIVDKDSVLVRIPSSKSNDDVKHLVQGKARWIFEKREEFQKQKGGFAPSPCHRVIVENVWI